MKIKINGKEEIINNSISITELLVKKNVDMPDMVSVELNGNILNRDEYSNILLNENDNVEFLYFMGGGDKW